MEKSFISMGFFLVPLSVYVEYTSQLPQQHPQHISAHVKQPEGESYDVKQRNP